MDRLSLRKESLSSSGYLTAIFGIISARTLGLSSMSLLPIVTVSIVIPLLALITVIAFLLSLIRGQWRVSLVVVSFWFLLAIVPFLWRSLPFPDYVPFISVVVPTLLSFWTFARARRARGSSRFSIRSLMCLTLIGGIMAAVNRHHEHPIVSGFIGAFVANLIMFALILFDTDRYEVEKSFSST